MQLFHEETSRGTVIAELSANHNHSYARAADLVKAAIDAGADAIKVQTYTADTITLDSDRPEFRIDQGTLWDGRRLYELYEEAHMPWEWQPELMKLCTDLGAPLFSSPFDLSAVAFLESLDWPAYKIASPEIVDRALIEACAATNKPMILSTGMASLDEIDEAVIWARAAGCEDLTLLKCTSAYPASPEEMNLRSMLKLQSEFGTRIGLSDHSMGHAAAVAAVALGATVIEKHFTLSRGDPGPDSAFSMEPQEFREMVDAIRVTEATLGDERWHPCPREEMNKSFRRSLYWVNSIKAGEIITPEHIRSVRPANGLAPKFLSQIMGCRAVLDVEAPMPVSAEHIDHALTH